MNEQKQEKLNVYKTSSTTWFLIALMVIILIVIAVMMMKNRKGSEGSDGVAEVGAFIGSAVS